VPLRAIDYQGAPGGLGDRLPDAIGAALLRAARLGRLVARPHARQSIRFLPDQPQEEPLGPESSDAPTETSWIEIELLDEEGNPVPDQAYRIELADGSVREGSLDSRGRAMVRGIDPGQCGITFPDLDEHVWKKAG
jgi:type VI secretion system secreted protein VgrG